MGRCCGPMPEKAKLGLSSAPFFFPGESVHILGSADISERNLLILNSHSPRFQKANFSGEERSQSLKHLEVHTLCTQWRSLRIF